MSFTASFTAYERVGHSGVGRSRHATAAASHGLGAGSVTGALGAGAGAHETGTDDSVHRGGPAAGVEAAEDGSVHGGGSSGEIEGVQDAAAVGLPAGVAAVVSLHCGRRTGGTTTPMPAVGSRSS